MVQPPTFFPLFVFLWLFCVPLSPSLSLSLSLSPVDMRIETRQELNRLSNSKISKQVQRATPRLRNCKDIIKLGSGFRVLGFGFSYFKALFRALLEKSEQLVDMKHLLEIAGQLPTTT